MCKLKCRYCSACPHINSCNYLDACTNTTVCKYMHSIQMQQPINEQTNKIGNNLNIYCKKVTNITKPMSIATTSSLRNKVERRAYDYIDRMFYAPPLPFGQPPCRPKMTVCVESWAVLLTSIWDQVAQRGHKPLFQ